MTPDFGMLRKIAAHMRKKDIDIIAKAGSGHPGGSLSIIELMSVLFFGKVMKYDPKDPHWPDRDRLILSKGHTCPALYVALAYAGFFPKKELETLRQCGSRLQGHTDLNFKTPGVETSGGPLGQGLSVALGMAIASKIDNRKNVIYTIIGDGESAKGTISEAAKCAGVLKMDNMITFFDFNKVDQDGSVRDVLPCNFVEEWKGYGWHVLECPGDNVERLYQTIHHAHSLRQEQQKPIVIIIDTIKGAGISFMEAAAREGRAEWHGVAPKNDYLQKARSECDKVIASCDAELLGNVDAYIQSVLLTLAEKEEASVSVDYHIAVAPIPTLFTEPRATRDGFGKYIVQLGQADPRIIAVTAGVAESVRLLDFAKEFGTFSATDRSGRFIQVGIAEANMAGVAAGLALAGKKPWMATFDIFIKECLGVIRNSICYNNVDVKIVGTHAGLGVEFDGGSHQSTIVPAIMHDLFRMECYEPADVNETMQLMKLTYNQNKAAYFRLTRQKLPLQPINAYPSTYGARIVKKSDSPQAVLVGSGAGVGIACKAAEELEQQKIHVLVLDLYSLSSVCTKEFCSLIPREIPIVTVHDARKEILAREIAYSLALQTRVQKIVACGMIEFGESGDVDSLYKKHTMDVASVVERVKESLNL